MCKQPIRRYGILAAALCAVPLSGALGAEDDATSVAKGCLHHPSIRKTKVLNDRNILYTMDNGTTYNNQLLKQCPSLRRNSPVSYTLANSKLCAGSTFTVLWQVGVGSNTTPYTVPGTNQHIALPGPAFIPAFVCQLGMFLPVSEDEVADLVANTEEPRNRRSRRRNAPDMIKTEIVELEEAPDAPAQPAP